MSSQWIIQKAFMTSVPLFCSSLSNDETTFRNLTIVSFLLQHYIDGISFLQQKKNRVVPIDNIQKKN